METLTEFFKWWIEYTYEHWLLSIIFLLIIAPNKTIRIYKRVKKVDKEV